MCVCACVCLYLICLQNNLNTSQVNLLPIYWRLNASKVLV